MKIPALFMYAFLSYSLVANSTSINETITSFESRLQTDPDNAPLHYEFGAYLAAIDQYPYYEKAYHHLKRSTELKPDQINWLFQFGSFCCRIGQFQDSLHAYSTILLKRPNLIPVLYNSSFTLKTAGEIDLAAKLYRKIITLQPDYNPAHLGLAFALLSKGDFKNGWQEHAWNLQQQGKNAPQLRNLLDDNAIAGKKILLTPEGGIGDTIQFVRYAQRLHHMGAHVIVAVQASLVPLLSNCPFIDQLFPINSAKPAYNAAATLMSLPALFGDTEKTIPTNTPYIFPPQDRIVHWQKMLQQNDTIKVGICWQPDVHNDVSRLPIARRGIPLSYFYKLGALPDVTLYSLQQKEGVEQLKNVPKSIHLQVFDEAFDIVHGSFIDTAAVMHSLDLIISTDTAVAHLAGAMGKRVWLLLPYATDWRWIWQRQDSPWYPTMRIFTQKKPFDWDSVIQEVMEAFKKEIQNNH